MYKKFLSTIKSYGLIEKGDKVVLAISGGPDSVAMLHLFCAIRDEWSLTLYAVHLNHQYRGELADRDAHYVEELCNSLEVQLFSFSSNVEAIAKELKTSFEDAGRQERYRLFFKIKDEMKADKIAVAQNKNDQAETVLMRLIRGSGIEGLSGIDYKRADNVIRPVLDLSRVEIESYCAQHELAPRIDHTNEDVKYTRNKIRKEVMKQMMEVNPLVIDQIVRTSHLLRDENTIIEKMTKEAVADCVENRESELLLDLNKFNALELALKRRILRACIKSLRGHLTDVSFDEIETIIELSNEMKTGNKKNYHKELTFEISYDNLLIYLGKKEKRTEKHSLKMKEMTREEFEQYSLLSHEIAIDKDKITGSLRIKNRENGDRFYPAGLQGQKKLKDFFIDKKVARDERDIIPIIRDDNGIVWIVGYRQDRRYLIDDNTSKVLILQCIKLLTK